MAGRVEGRVAIVTGAAHGVGRAVAQLLAAEGARVVLADTDEEAVHAAAESIGGEDRARVETFCCDVCQRLGVNNLLAATVSAFDRVDIVVNAARRIAYGDVLEIAEEDFDAVLDGNLKSAFLLSQAAAKRMIQQAGEAPEGPVGAVVNVTSVAAQLTLPELAPYSVSCAAVDQLTRSMAVALAPRGVRVNAVSIGGVMTGALKDALREREDLRGQMIGVTPIGRIGEPAEAAEVAVFLASDAASFVTGQIVAVDGGRSLLDPLAIPTS